MASKTIIKMSPLHSTLRLSVGLRINHMGGKSVTVTTPRSANNISTFTKHWSKWDYVIGSSDAIASRAIKKQFRASSRHRSKLSYVSGTSDVPLLGTTIGKELELRAEATPDKKALIFFEDKVELSMSELLEKADALAAGLLQLGVSPGDRVGIWGPNTVEWTLTQYATARAGIILVNINPSYRANELKYALKKAGCKVVVAAPGFKTIDYVSMLRDLIPDMDSKSHGQKVQTPEFPDLNYIITMGPNRHRNCLRFEDVIDMATPSQRSQISDLGDRLQFDDPINIQFTSGTTGNPKGATLSHHNILNNAFFVGRRLGFHKQEAVICAPLPLYHCGGMVLACLQCVAHGSTIVFPSPSFDALNTLQAVETFRCTALYGVPTMFIDMLNHPQCKTTDFSSLNTGIMAGAPCPIETMKEVIDVMNIQGMTVCYGSTETSPVSFQTTSTCPIDKRVATVGKTLEHVENKIVDEEGRVVPIGHFGEVCTRGTSVMLGYWKDTDKTKAAISSTGWYHTGDLGVMTEDGYCSIVGRNKDMIIRGGENIYPLEVEQVLYGHPGIKDAQVIGVPDKRLGEEVCAWVMTKEGVTLTEKDIKDFCKNKITSFKIPRHVLFVDSFPTTVTGKIQKYIMRDQSTSKLGL